MRNAKKLMLLLLSLALLCGIFAVAALAEEPATEATVVYPDGSTEVVAVGQTITPKTFTDGLYYGKGNTLFKDDATEGWVFTVDGAALSDLTVTQAMAGKKIIASGADKVYYTSEEIAADYSSKIIYHLTDDVKYYFSTSNLGDKGDGTNTGASHYQDLRAYPAGTEGRNTVKDIVVKLYEDVVAEKIYMNWFIDQASRASGRNAYLDLNGHSVVNRSTGYMDINGISLRLYSSQPGAHWYQPNSAAAFYVSDDATLYLGNNSTGNATYSDNLSVHCKTLFDTMYGSGAAILGGHYYQLEGANTYLVRISRRLSTMQNASFYVQDGNALLATPDDLSSQLAKAANCEFYSLGESVLITGEKGIALTFENCAFYGIDTEVAETTAKLTLDDACTKEETASFKTVTFADGTTQKYVAATLEEAKAFVESHPKAAPAQDAKYVGDDYMVRSNPVSVFAYDEAFNATVTVEGEYDAKVYYVIDSVLYGKIFVTENNLGAYLSKMTHGGATITLYEDATVSATAVKAERVFVNSVNRSYAESAKYFLDLNGHTIKASSSSGTFMDVKAANFYIYSSVPGGVIDAGGHVFFRTNNDDYKWIDGRAYDSDSAKYKEEAYAGYATIVPRASAFIGEDDDDNTAYDQNLTVYCARINTDMYGTNAKLLGGTYVQKGANSANFFMQMGREKSDSSHVYEVKNATFIVSDYDDAMIHLRCNADRTFTNCTFVSLNPAGAPLTSYTEYANTFTFVDCNFVNVLPRLGDAYIVYTNAAFGTTGAYTVDDLDITDEAAQYIAHGTSAKTIEANGKTYRLDGAFITDPAAALKITHEGFGTDYWAIGTTVSVALDEIVKIEGDKIYSGAYYDYSAIDAIEDGVVTKAGEATAPIGFANADELAFSYLDTKTGILYGVSYKECGETAKGVGDKFHELFSVPASAYEITMYKDMVLSKAVSFGPLVKQKDQYNRDYFDSFVNGDIVWDLNGTTVTIAENVTGLVKLAAANCNTSATDPGNETWTGDTVFGFEGQTAKSGSFTLKSSKAGAQIINESSAKLFGVGEGKYSKLVIYGENLTVTSPKSLIIATIEMNWDVTAVHHQIYGGTYIGGSAEGVLRISRSGSIENATLISTNAGAAQVVVLDGYRSGTINIKNCVFAAENANAVAVGVVGGSQKYTLTLDGCTLANVKATEAGDRYNSVTYTGATVVSNAADLALIYPTAPEGKVVAYASVSVNGKAYKVCGYYAAAEVVTVQIPLAGLTELWAAGSEFIAPENNADLSVVEKDGKLYYRANPVWMGKIDGVAVDEILALENAGKTVVLDVEGELETVYAVAEKNGVNTYFHGENAAAEIVAYLGSLGATNTTFVFHEDITLYTASNSGLTIQSSSGDATHYIDLNGCKITLAYAGGEATSYGLYFINGKIYVYSSAPGAVIDATVGGYFWMTDTGADAFLGEPNATSTAYGKNLTVICKCMNGGRLWSDGGAIYGGTYVQAEGVSADLFIAMDDGSVINAKNATFVMNKINAAVIRRIAGNFDNCTFISATEAKLMTTFGSGKDGSAIFNNCYFYNVIPYDSASVTYENCYFNNSYGYVAGGYIAFTGETVTVEANGKAYAFGAQLVAEAALIDWGFGTKEYWAIGATASRADALIDGFFTYGYESFVVEGDAAPKATLKAIADGTLQMNLTLQDKIGVNLFFAEALADAIVKFGGAEIALADRTAEDGFYKLSTAIAPNVANLDYNVTVVIGENEHVITLSVGTYAEKILATDTYANVHKLTYAMVEYVRAMANDADFLADVQKPAGYEAQLPGEAAYEKGENTLLTGLRFNLSGTIALEIKGAAAKGMEVTLVLANGRTEVATVDENGSAIFVGLYVNDFAGEMEITVGEEVYSYSIENYYNALDAEDSQEAIAALYNYAQYAAAYVELLQNAD